VSVRILIGDCRERLRELPDASIDSVVCDPPYEIGFMGKAWDATGIANDVTVWRECLRVLKPGSHLVAFSGTRTYHRMACAIEDAGFEIRDQLAWVYGSGFPKSHNQPGGWGTALKPAWEPICLARKPLVGTVAANMAAYGTGCLNIDGCRVSLPDGDALHDGVKHDGHALDANGAWGFKAVDRAPGLGRWPANIIHDGSDEVLAGFPETQDGVAVRSRSGGNNIFSDKAKPQLDDMGYGGGGSAARFFYCAKATTEERGEGNNHPTVKPIDLMRWLCRLVTPKGGTVLDPFAGSGSTLIAADAEQFHAIGCELSPDYAAIAERRVRDAAGMFAEVRAA
jgi:site-specific DNA-methyltransferase (adenine-specific)